MGIATQLLQGANLVMVGSEITQKATRHGAITADGVRLSEAAIESTARQKTSAKG